MSYTRFDIVVNDDGRTSDELYDILTNALCCKGCAGDSPEKEECNIIYLTSSSSNDIDSLFEDESLGS